MRYAKQFLLLLVLTLVGEMFNDLVPLKIPASIWGLLLLLTMLKLKIIRLEQIEETSHFLITILPILFIPPTLGIAGEWGNVKGLLPEIFLVVIATTTLTMVVSGKLTELILVRRREDD
ncbi:CidA/LrgA family protein [Trichococcus ilyis]|jgi:holin-like protein|uniref:Holin-like protein n=1 Tax=Trichococcus ilyis TaxID=640938 RepID=A0A143Z7U6_9LACT|nr:CidA/LrgA family protein [Trichococcus ilyis]CZR10218.1 Hypothetical protein TR210_2884 [Trichococcus ilyis]SEJ93707.1 holin-like protein [Trichococcus ilyis]